MKVYFIRHGETNGNVQKFHQGWGDSHLTDAGVRQAETARDIITKKEFDRILCSDLLRTRQTCDIIFGKDASVEYDARLREINNSVFMGQYQEDLYKKYGEEYRENCRRMDYSSYGGESNCEMLARTADFLHYLEQDTDSKRIAVVTHGGTIKAIIANILGCELYGTKIKIDNCSVSTIKYNNGNWTLVHVNNRQEI